MCERLTDDDVERLVHRIADEAPYSKPCDLERDITRALAERGLHYRVRHITDTWVVYLEAVGREDVVPIGLWSLAEAPP